LASNLKTTFIEERLDALRKQGLYRSLRNVVVRGPIATVDGRDAIHLCSNDYLGLSQNRHILKKTIESMREVSQCSSRLIAGNHPKLIELENLLAKHRKTECALIYPTGYSANLGVIMAIADKNSTIFSDELNHASIIDACKISGAKVVVFRHNDTIHLQKQMQQAQGRKIVITEGVFSMDGDIGKISEICSIANDHRAITIIDDAHADFVFGPNFAGIPANFGVQADIHISSLSKGLGCFGGYVASTMPVRELLVNISRQFIYTSALPQHLCSAAIAAIPIAKVGNLQKNLQWNIRYFSSVLREMGFDLANSSSQIVPILIGPEEQAVQFSNELLNRHVFAQAIRYPSVSKGHARIRVTITAMHRKKHLDAAVEAFEDAGKKVGII
jgi:glycine C-acetyltransferase